MALYAAVYQVVGCSNCSYVGDVEVQFMFGQIRSPRYQVGDPIVWGEDSIGQPGRKNVVALGLGGCSRCNHTEWKFDIYIVENRILCVQFHLGEIDYPAEEYVVLAP